MYCLIFIQTKGNALPELAKQLTIRRIVLIIIFFPRMNGHRSDTSVLISKQISDYLVNRARQVYLDRIKNEAINEKSIQESLVFPKECIEKIVSLDRYQPNYQSLIGLKEEHQHLPPSAMKDFHRSARMTHNPTRYSKQISRTNSIAHSSTFRKKLSSSSLVPNKKCLPLVPTSEENDLEIQNLRIRKQKMHDLQEYFLISEKEEKSKSKPQVLQTFNHSNFTTDFNGEKLEVKPIYYKKEAEPYSIVTITPTIRQERQENKYFLTCQKLKENDSNGYKKENSLSIPKKTSTYPKESCIFDAFTIKEIENFMNRENRRKKESHISRISRKSRVRMPQILSIMRNL